MSITGVRAWACLIVLATLAGCASHRPAPVIDRVPAPPPAAQPVPAAPPPPTPEVEAHPETYTVKAGDTLYKIALDLGLDYRELAAWNNIENVNIIRNGQVLRITPPGEVGENGVVTAPLRTTPPPGEAKTTLPGVLPPARANTALFKSTPKAVKLPYSEEAYAQLSKSATPAPASSGGIMVASAPSSTAPVTPPPAATAVPAPAAPPPSVPPSSAPPAQGETEDQVDWSWPTSGKVLTPFNDSANLKGVDISGKSGQPVTASAAGKVVYAGSGLRGYGKLVIIKHNKTFLSAYAHNSNILVKEGQQVTKGQKIAEMGNSDADAVKLHFEIRRLGKPVDPLKFLPPA
jgi:lipoprotein NlpD